VDQRLVGEAVLVLLRLDQEEDALAVLVEEVVVGVDLVELRGGDDDADVADAEGFGGEFLEHGEVS
jgi:hypothetical protein